jgi:hypothetical protein
MELKERILKRLLVDKMLHTQLKAAKQRNALQLKRDQNPFRLNKEKKPLIQLDDL